MLRIHKIILGITFAGVALLLLWYVLLIRPRVNDAYELRDDLMQKEKRLRAAKWPMQQESLEKILKSNKEKLSGKKGLQARSDEAWKLMTSALEGRIIDRGFGTSKDFGHKVLNTHFQQEFSEMQTRFEAKGIYVCPEVMDLSMTSKTKYNYQLLLQCWSVDMLVEQVVNSGLRFRIHGDIKATTLEGRKAPAALITVLPMKAYTVEEKKGVDKPYLLEFPVRLGVVGQLSQIIGFMESLNQPGHFFGIRGFEFIQQPPRSLKADSEGHVEPGELHLNIECVAYLKI